MLYDVVLIHIEEVLDNQTVGMSMIVGMMIFSIVVDLSFVRSQYHMYLRLLLIVRDPQLLRRRRILRG